MPKSKNANAPIHFQWHPGFPGKSPVFYTLMNLSGIALTKSSFTMTTVKLNWQKSSHMHNGTARRKIHFPYLFEFRDGILRKHSRLSEKLSQAYPKKTSMMFSSDRIRHPYYMRKSARQTFSNPESAFFIIINQSYWIKPVCSLQALLTLRSPLRHWLPCRRESFCSSLRRPALSRTWTCCRISRWCGLQRWYVRSLSLIHILSERSLQRSEFEKPAHALSRFFSP